MKDITKKFIKENRHRLICEPSGLTLEELLEAQIQRVRILQEMVDGTKNE